MFINITKYNILLLLKKRNIYSKLYLHTEQSSIQTR